MYQLYLNCIVLIVLVFISFSHGYSAILAAKVIIKLDLTWHVEWTTWAQGWLQVSPVHPGAQTHRAWVTSHSASLWHDSHVSWQLLPNVPRGQSTHRETHRQRYTDTYGHKDTDKVSATEASLLLDPEYGTLYRQNCDMILAFDSLGANWSRICLTRTLNHGALWHIDSLRLRNILTYLLTYLLTCSVE